MAMRTNEPEIRPVRNMLRRLIAAPAAWSFLWPIGLIIIGYYAYHRWGAEQIRERFESIALDQITVPPAHAMLRNDVAAEVYKDMALNDLSHLDPMATARIAAAFSSHPWVRHVDSVRKLPGGAIDVQLKYRVPVAVFRLTSATRRIDGDHLFALDGEGVLLPNDKLTAKDAQELIHIEVLEVKPQGIKGGPFGEQRVEAAAQLAGILAPMREQAQITKITAIGDSRTNIVPQLEITIGNDIRLFWGSPPGREQPGERKASEKIKDLVGGNFRRGDDLRVARRKIGNY